MASKKCPECGLVSFASSLKCKRCQTDLSITTPVAKRNNIVIPDPPPPQNNFTPIATQRKYQTPTNTIHRHEAPPPPPQFHGQRSDHSYEQKYKLAQCVKCGESQQDVQIHDISRKYVPPAVYLGLFFGLLPAAILGSIFQVKHKFNLAFCGECWSKYRLVSTYETLSTLGFICIFIIGSIIGVASGSWLIFFLFLIIAAGVAAIGIKYKQKHCYKIKKINRKRVIIESKTNGELVFER